MGVGRIAFDDWNGTILQSLSCYEFISDEANAPNRIGVVTNLDLSALISPIPCELSRDEIHLLSRFTDIVHGNMFGSSPPKTSFQIYFAVSANGVIDFPTIRSIVNFMPRVYLDLEKHEPVPFIVYSTTSKRHHLVTEILRRSPVTYPMNSHKWKGQAGVLEPPSDDHTLARYYKAKYGVTVHGNQPIFISRLGACLKTRSLAGGAHEQKKLKEGDKSTLYLVPQLVCRSPLTDIAKVISDLPYLLFWITSGLIAINVLKKLGMVCMIKVPGTSVSSPSVIRMDDQVISFLIPSTFRRYRSDLVSLAVIALTCPGANLPYNYDHLEWLGDAVWRLVACHEAVVRPKIAPHISNIMSNDRMGRLCGTHCPLIHESSVLSLPPSPKNPQSCRPKLKNYRILANIVEALLGVCYIGGGVSAALCAARNMGILEVSDLKEDMSLEIKPCNIAAKKRLEQSLQVLRIANKFVRVGELERLRNTMEL